MNYNILVINWHDIAHPLGGGAEVHLHEIFKRLVQRGHKVTLLCSRLPKTIKRSETSTNTSTTQEYIDGIKIIRNGRRHNFNLVVPGAYYKLSRENNFDVVFDDINKIPFYTPVYVRRPLIGIVHHLFGKTVFKEAIFPAALYVYGCERLIPTIYHKIPIMAVSESTKAELVALGLEADKIDIVYNGVDCNTFRPLNHCKSERPLVGYMGRLKRYKCIDHLILAMRQVVQAIPEARLLIVGDGDYQTGLQKLVSELKLESCISFTGAVSEEKKVEYLNQMWVSVNPSPKEGWGITVVEANACGTPVIAADSPGLRDSVVHQKTGLLYSYGNIQQLTDAIITVLTKADLREKLSRNALSWARKFDWNVSAEKTLHLIERLLHGRQR